MEVMTYILWVLLLMGSVMKNYIVAASVPKTGQALPAVEGTAASLAVIEARNEIVFEFREAVNSTFNKQAFGWLDTS